MSKRSRRPKPARSTSRRSSRRSPVRASSRREREPDLMAGVAEALAADDPLPLLGLASTLLSAFDDGPSLRRPHEPALPTRDDLWQTFFDVDLIETSGLLAPTPRLAGEQMFRHRVRREIGSRAHVLPRWLLAMEQAEPVDDVFVMRHV